MRQTPVITMLCLLACAGWHPPAVAADPGPQALATVLRDFRRAEAPPEVGGVPDYGDAATATRLEALSALQARHAALDPAGWSRGDRADWLLVRSILDQHEFTLRVHRPWARDPGFYLDPLLQLAFTPLPMPRDGQAILRQRLREIPGRLAAARVNLDEAAADYADLAIRNLVQSDGVDHEQPYRGTPPAGIIGWYDDLLARAQEKQRALVPDIRAASDALRAYHAWLVAERPRMTAPAGVGAASFDWYLKHVKLMPYTSAELLVLGERELQRNTAYLALERHRNRALPPQAPAASREEYAARIAEADAAVRSFVEREQILTIPPWATGFDHNVPWRERAGGRNFWEEIQFRDPRPDHVHAVIPGHRFDALVTRRLPPHPVRTGYSDGGRVEGWGVYLEEMFLQAGFLEQQPRTRELFHIFAIKRATRVHADIMMQSNRMTAAQAVRYMRERVPYLDEDVARVDAEIYLRWPPGYGVSYTIGKMQMDQMLADRSRQLGGDFVLRDFHDAVLAAGQVPLSLVRYELTGYDDEMQKLWPRDPLPVAN